MEVVTQREFREFLLEHRTQMRQVTRDLEFMKSVTVQDVGTEMALRITGISLSSLTRERDRPGTLIKWKKDGKTCLYDIWSLKAYNESRNMEPLPQTMRAA
ncbi:hypothetical protein [Nibribacter koreensis]|uniref:DNA-binding protein n=1 Tax=Nibribacter koreensis TaxID=1084519 RepID=A0ABP8FBA6_9BACT